MAVSQFAIFHFSVLLALVHITGCPALLLHGGGGGGGALYCNPSLGLGLRHKVSRKEHLRDERETSRIIVLPPRPSRQLAQIRQVAIGVSFTIFASSNEWRNGLKKASLYFWCIGTEASVWVLHIVDTHDLRAPPSI
jgi:hypothetical protein